jgi:transcriptional regulator
MYRPAAFVADAAEAACIIAGHPLAQLVVSGPDGLVATPVPLLRRGTSLVGHLARPNAVWRLEGDAMAIFTGPSGYISPRWYEGKAVDGKVVPTWNYETVHVRGRLVAHDERAWKLAVVRLLTDTFEASSPTPWSVDDAPADYFDTMLRGIVGIELVDLRVEGKRKLSQNRSAVDQATVRAATGLAESAVRKP